MFNTGNHTKNAMYISLTGLIYNVVNLLGGFFYRYFFLTFLSENYLGINGLFNNILSILTLSDLGISSAIAFRLYKPIRSEDTLYVGKIMCFFCNVYRVVFWAIMFMGIAICPFIPKLISSSSNIPKDINIYFVFILFLLQTASSYLFAYRQILLSADQRQFVVFGFNTIGTLIKYILQILILVFYKNYTVTLIVGIILNVLSNYVLSLIAKIRYKPIFEIHESISIEEKRKIFEETKACMLHLIGSKVLTATDNIVLSKYINIAVTGIYSNYYLVISSLSTVITQLIGNFTAAIGDIYATNDKEKVYSSYKNLVFINFWITSSCTICLYYLINLFISVWLGNNMLFSNIFVVAICIQFYIETNRIIQGSFTSGCGMYAKDYFRPLIESFVNLISSIWLVKKIGVSGVVIGTIISHMLTVFWREPYILHRYVFLKKMNYYWTMYGLFTLITVGLCSFKQIIIVNIHSFLGILGFGMVLFISLQAVFWGIFHKKEEFNFVKNKLDFVLRDLIRKIKNI